MVLILLGFSRICLAQGEDNPFKVVLLKAKKGAVMVFAGKKHSLTLDIQGDAVKPAGQPNFVLVNEKIVQVSCIPIPGGKDASKCTIDQQQEILNGYVNYEMDYFKKELKLATGDLKKEWLVLQGRQYLLWYFDVPKQKVKGSGEVAKQTNFQVYMSAIWFDQILDINNPVLDGKDLSKAKALLIPIARTLKSYEGELDIEAFSKKLE